MKKKNSEAWIKLFSKTRIPKSVSVLQEINLGYTSIVYHVSVDGINYAVKMYDPKFNGRKVCIQEKNNILKAQKYIDNVVPKVFLFSIHTENIFDKEILVMENLTGVPLSKEVFNNQVFDKLKSILIRLHNSDTNNSLENTELEKLEKCRRLIMNFLKENQSFDHLEASKHLDDLEKYYYTKKNIFRTPKKSIIHGDLWWDNILVNNGEIKIIDWLESSENDYCRDLAQFKIGVLDELFDENQTNHYLGEILVLYKEYFQDESIYERMRFYVPLLYLEESFYLPFKYFNWKIKFNENPKNFEKRFVEYFRKSEMFFNN
jgi:tRNA A-37 threonylcarbamoyl transferase component Bud32